MSDLEQQTDAAEVQVKPRSRKLAITLIVILCVVLVLCVGWYLMMKDLNNQVDGWWNEIRHNSSEVEDPSRSGGSGNQDPGNL